MAASSTPCMRKSRSKDPRFALVAQFDPVRERQQMDHAGEFPVFDYMLAATTVDSLNDTGIGCDLK